MSHNPARSVEMWRSPSSCSGTIQRLGKVLQGCEDVSNDVQGLEGGLERFGESGAVWGGSASLACP